MKKRHFTVCVLVLLGVTITIGAMINQTVSAMDVPRITIDDLKQVVDKSESEIIILDVRTGSSWGESEVMIKDAVRENPNDFGSWAEKYPKEKRIVLYCT